MEYFHHLIVEKIGLLFGQSRNGRIPQRCSPQKWGDIPGIITDMTAEFSAEFLQTAARNFGETFHASNHPNNEDVDFDFLKCEITDTEEPFLHPGCNKSVQVITLRECI